MENANLYAHANALQKRDSFSALREVLPQMDWDNNQESVLDVGCGSGDVTKTVLLPLLPNNIGKVVGLDVSSQMVDFAQKHFDHNLIEYRQMDIAKVTNPRQHFPEGFTKITSFYCLHWIQDQETCLTNMFLLLREGGQAFLVFLANNPIFAMYERMSLKEKWKKYMMDVSNYIPVFQYKKDPVGYFKDLANDVGFQVDLCSCPEMEFPFTNVNYLKQAVTAVNPFVKRIPEEEKEEFVMDCLQELMNISPKNENGDTVANYRLMVALLTKNSETCG